MKKNFSFLLAISLPIALLFTSCSNNLSKSEAKKQIEGLLNKEPASCDFFCYYSKYTNFENYTQVVLPNAKKAGYIDYTVTRGNNETQGSDWSITLKDKIKPYIIKKSEHTEFNRNYCYLTINVGKYEVEIISITEPAPDMTGKIVCNVEYLSKFIENDLYKIFNTPIKDENKKATFIKMQDGWELENRR